MAWYIRKSLRINKLLRLNLSKSGLGFSAGVKGARVGINSQGKPYTHVGRHGLYHRKTYGRRGGIGNTGSSPSNKVSSAALLLTLPTLFSLMFGNWLVVLFTVMATFFLLGVYMCTLVLFPGLMAPRRKRLWQKSPMTQLQEAHIYYLFNERELPRTANYTDGKTGLAAFKATYGQPSQREAAGLISFLEGLPIRRDKPK